MTLTRKDVAATVFVVLSRVDCDAPPAVEYFVTRVIVRPLCVLGPQVTVPAVAEYTHELSA